MGFIEKKNPVILNIKVTDAGRRSLSKGNLRFNYFALGDSEINYDFIRKARQNNPNFNVFGMKMLKPKDKNPNILSFITREFIGANDLFNNPQLNPLNNVPSITWQVENCVDNIGFFQKSDGKYTFKTTPDYIKQPDMMVDLSNVLSGDTITLRQSPTFGANVTEPQVGDILMIRWTLDIEDLDATTGYTINPDQPHPILFYRIYEIISGSINNDNLVVRVDRQLPLIGGYQQNFAGAMVFDFDLLESFELQFSTDYASEALISFLQNCQCDTIIYPYWNLSILYLENIAGVQKTDQQFTEFKSGKYAGFVSYIQNQEIILNKLGIIHYTNQSPANAYGEELLLTTPKLHIPTIMWHKSSQLKMGLTLTAIGQPKIITGVETSLNAVYHDLADENGNIVGKVFNALKIFVIEDQELLFAMSFKSNRSWTLPDYGVGANDSIFIGCPECLGIDFTYEATNITMDNEQTQLGSIEITSIFNRTNPGSDVLLTVSGQTQGVIYTKIISDLVTISNLEPDTYTVTIYDLSAPNSSTCFMSKTVVIESEIEIIPSVDTVDGVPTTTTIATGGMNIIGWQNVTGYGLLYRPVSTTGLGVAQWIMSPAQPITQPLINNSFAHTIIGLNQNQTYEYKAFIIINVDGESTTVEGNVLTTQTLFEPTQPTVTTGNVLNSTIETTRFTVINNEIVSDGGVDLVEYGLIWSTTISGTSLNLNNYEGKIPIIPGSLTPAIPFNYNSLITNLSPNTKVFFRAYAINNLSTNNTNYGITRSQTTLDQNPSVQTKVGVVDSVLGTIETGGQNIVMFEDVDEWGMQYRESVKGATWQSFPSSLNTSELTNNQYDVTISGLTNGKTYQYRAVIVVDGQEYFGRSFIATIDENRKKLDLTIKIASEIPAEFDGSFTIINAVTEAPVMTIDIPDKVTTFNTIPEIEIDDIDYNIDASGLRLYRPIGGNETTIGYWEWNGDQFFVPVSPTFTNSLEVVELKIDEAPI